MGVGQTTHPANRFLGGGWVGPPTQQTGPWVGGGPENTPGETVFFKKITIFGHFGHFQAVFRKFEAFFLVELRPWG